LKTVVIILVVLNLLAAFFLMPANNGITGVSSSPKMSASGLALLSEVEVELKAPVVEKVAPITVVESTPVVEEIVSNHAVAAQETLVSNESVSELAVITLRNPKLILKEKPAFQCGAIQGIKSIDAASQLKAKLAKLKVKNFIISTSDQVADQYWVYLGPYRTKQVAIDTNAKLRERDRGGYFFTNDEVKNSISLGVFSSAVNAGRLQAKLNRQGYRANIWNQQLVLFTLTAQIPVNYAAISALIGGEGYVLTECK
jgi:hypothetical protein